MAFSRDETVIHIKLTDKGRELLSRGELRFTKYGIGDSEIDYAFNASVNLDSANANLLRPVDKNPDIVSFIKQTETSENLVDLGTVVSNTSVITNTAIQRGMFDVTGSTTTIFSDPSHAKQADMQVAISGVSSGTTLTLNQAPTYGANPTEPVVGDYVMVKWANPNLSAGTVNFTVDQNVPYIWYKIQDIISGSLASNNLVVEVDRDLPDFGGSGSSITAGALLYPNNNGSEVSGDSIQNYYGAPFVTDFVSEAMIAFLENYDTPTIDVPVWNMSIIFTEEIAGIQQGDRNLSQYKTVTYGQFVQYIQKLDTSIKKIGLIHYSNLSPSNNYGEGLNEATPILDLPSVMWHKSASKEIGLQLTADAASKAQLPELNTEYHNLVDPSGNIVGKVFNDLKLFVIEDQDLLFAMTYKSNRSWTLPSITSGFNIQLCPVGDVQITNIVVTP